MASEGKPAGVILSAAIFAFVGAAALYVVMVDLLSSGLLEF
jgi:hypothetical protein